MKRILTKIAIILASSFVGAGIGFLIVLGFGKIGTIGMIGILGAIAGIASLAWQVRDRILWIPKISVTAEVVYKDKKPANIRHIIINKGKPTEIIRWGFASDNKEIIYCFLPGLIPHIARKGVPLVHDFEIDDIIQSATKKNCSIRLAFAEDEKGAYLDKIPQYIIDIFDSLIAGNKNT